MPGESYMLAGPRATLADGLRRIATIAGTKGPVVLPDAWSARPAAVAGAVGRVVPLPPDFAAETMRASLATYLGSPGEGRARARLARPRRSTPACGRPWGRCAADPRPLLTRSRRS